MRLIGISNMPKVGQANNDKKGVHECKVTDHIIGFHTQKSHVIRRLDTQLEISEIRCEKKVCHTNTKSTYYCYETIVSNVAFKKKRIGSSYTLMFTNAHPTSSETNDHYVNENPINYPAPSQSKLNTGKF